MKSVLILGIGNVLLCDEGVGVHAVRRMASMRLPPGVEALDGGTSGADLVDALEGRDKVVVIDCVAVAGEPGTIVRLGWEQLQATPRPLGLHELGLVESLQIARHLGCLPSEVIVLGVVPASIKCGLELSPQIESVLPSVIDLALAEATGHNGVVVTHN